MNYPNIIFYAFCEFAVRVRPWACHLSGTRPQGWVLTVAHPCERGGEAGTTGDRKSQQRHDGVLQRRAQQHQLRLLQHLRKVLQVGNQQHLWESNALVIVMIAHLRLHPCRRRAASGDMIANGAGRLRTACPVHVTLLQCVALWHAVYVTDS